MQEQVENENAYSHSLSYQHSCENNNNRRRASLQQVADPLQRARNREKKWRRRCCSSSSQWEATCLPPSLSFPLSQPYWFIPLVYRILTIYSYVATLARIIHGKFTKSRRKTKMKLRPIKFVHIKYKISQVTNFKCPPSPLSVSFLWLSLWL